MESAERMEPYFAVFNCHINDAQSRADAEFTLQFGQEAFDKSIKPLHEAGIMSIFGALEGSAANIHAGAWVALCTFFVNTPTLVVKP